MTAACADRRPGGLRIERFAVAEQPPPVRDTAYEVELRQSGTVLVLHPGDSVLDALVGAGAPVLASCRQGLCGTCETAVVSGSPDHRDSLVDRSTADGDRSFYPCVSRSASDRLVLDL
ncbi:unannotated protein [freshwater metagenome]|uniref:Unannotated protein n=1 Tax=freshwater metagenome TaxID=449393 RepID=A0A6J7H0N4_9ZZZZ